MNKRPARTAVMLLIALLTNVPAPRADDFSAQLGAGFQAISGATAGRRKDWAAAQAIMKHPHGELRYAKMSGPATFQGTLTLLPGASYRQNDSEGRPMRLVNGPAAITYLQVPLFTDGPSLEFYQAGRSAMVDTGGTRLESIDHLVAAPKTGAGLAFQGHAATAIVSREEHEGKVPCTHIGYCYGYGPTLRGKLENGWAMRMCSGTQKARLRVTTHVTTYSVDVVSCPDHGKVGVIVGEPVRWTSQETLATLGACE